MKQVIVRELIPDCPGSAQEMAHEWNANENGTVKNKTFPRHGPIDSFFSCNERNPASTIVEANASDPFHVLSPRLSNVLKFPIVGWLVP